MSVRFVHAADVHLGSPLKTVGAESARLREQLEDATYAAFERIVDVAIDEAVDFVVVAGDLYDQDSRSVRANEFVVEQFERLADETIPAYVCYGNHDPVDGATEYFDLPENVHEFAAEDAEEVTYPAEGPPAARLWGQSYRSRSDDRKMPYHYTPDDDSVPTIGVVHTGLNPEGRKYVPCSVNDLLAKEEIHYWALGHVHRRRVENVDPPVVYPGIPQGRQITESGVGGCVLVELDAGGAADLKFVPTSPIVWRRVEVDVEATEGSAAVENVGDLEDRLLDELYAQEYDLDSAPGHRAFDVRADGWEPDGYVCRWELTGRAPVREVVTEDDEVLDVLRERLREEADHPRPFVWTEAVRDRTRRPLPDVDDVWAEDQVFAEFERVLETVREEPGSADVLREVAGEIWYEPESAEDDRPTELRLTDEKLSELLDSAEALAVDELLARRYA